MISYLKIEVLKIKMRKVIIWGAGRIGRGFAAEIFYDNEYELHFVDSDEKLIEQLRIADKYTVYKIPGADNHQKIEIKGFSAYKSKDEKALSELFEKIDLMTVSVFPEAFKTVTEQIGRLLSDRAKRNPESRFDIIILANKLHAGSIFRKMLEDSVEEEIRSYIENNVGISESVVARMAVEPTNEMKIEDPLVIATNGYPRLIVDGESFAGEKPNCKGIEYVSNFAGWEIRKLYTYNMLHALFAYAGIQKNYNYVYECTQDEDIMTFARGAMEEVGIALKKAFGFSDYEINKWNDEVFKNMSNPYLKDKLTRVGGDPVRKLKSGDRLAGAAVLCKRSGNIPFWITKAIAYAFMYDVYEDASSQQIQRYIKHYGVKEAIRKYCGFEKEPELVQLVADRFIESYVDPAAHISEDALSVSRYKEAWKAGYDHEQKFKGCGQCALLAIRDVFGIFDEKVFEAATALSGGMSLCGDGVCGGYTGALLAIGLKTARTLEDLKTKEKTGQYGAYELSAKLHDLFVECYGSVICSDIHQCIFNRAYILRDKEVRDLFETAGAHADKCTSVIGMTLYMFSKVIIDYDTDIKETI